jgi:hypothetical protein
MENKQKNWDKVIEELTSGIDLTRTEGKNAAYQRCISYAETHLAGDMWCNAFLAHAAHKLGTEQVMRDVAREIVPLSESARVHIATDPQEGPVITANREGLRYLAELFRVLAQAPCTSEHAHLYWDEAPLSGETYGLVVYLEEEEWFERFAQDYYSSLEDEQHPFKREINAETVMAIQFPASLASSLAVTPQKIYLVQSLVKRCGDDVWTKLIRDDDSRVWIFTIRDDEGMELKIGLDLDDPEIVFLTREELDQFIQ